MTTSQALASSWVTSISEQCSVLVLSRDRRMSPTCSAPHLEVGRGGVRYTDAAAAADVWGGGWGGSPHLSATLAALILSMMMTCLLLYIVVLRLIPRLEEGLFTISTSRGPEACCTASGRKDAEDEGMDLDAGGL